MKTGLVLEGGAMRGMFTAGVLDVLMEHGITVDGAIGVSAGAVFGCNYKSHQIGRTIRYSTEYCKDKRYASFGNLLRTGNLYSEQFCYHTVPEKLDPFDAKTFREDPMDFFLVCTDVRTGDPIYHKCRTGDAEAADATIAAVKQLSADVGIPANLHGILKEEDIRFLAESAYADACRPGNPRDTSVEEIVELYKSQL